MRLNQLTEEKEEQERLLEEKMERYVYLCDLADRIAGAVLICQAKSPRITWDTVEIRSRY